LLWRLLRLTATGHLLHLGGALRRHLWALLALLHQSALRLGRLDTLIHSAGRDVLGEFANAVAQIASNVRAGRQYG
jgi:hypothetical protein